MSFLRKQLHSQTFYLWLVGCVLTAYALLRAWFVAPLHDENATFFHFIETGAIWGQGSLLDANNHLLNSYIGRFFYNLLGEHYFLFRLPTVLSAGLYFWVIWKLTSTFASNWQRWLVTLAIVCIPFVFDYFSYTRGYGLALCFFCCSLYFLQRWLLTSKYHLLIALVLCLVLSISANLTFLVSAVLVMVYVIGFVVIHFKLLNRWKIFWLSAAILLFVLALKPLLGFSFELRDVGALYYGSLDGFWPVTGKTLCKYVLFYDANWLKWAIGIGAVAIGVLVLILLRRHRFKSFLQRPESWGSYLLVGNVVSILFLAKVMHINYPEDRAAMYFIPLVLLVFGSVLGQFIKLKWLLLALLFFPISFLWQLNVRTSVFTPDQRMSLAFYQEVRDNLQPEDRLCIDPIQQLNWAHFERNYQSQPHFGVADRTFEGNYDVIISNKIFPITKAFKRKYKILAFDPDNGVIAYRRKVKSDPVIFKSNLSVSPYEGTDEFIDLLRIKTAYDWEEKVFSLDISGKITIDTSYRDLQLVVATADSTGKTVTLHSFNLRWYFGEKKHRFSYHFPYTRIPLTASETELKVYIWNPERHFVGANKTRITLKK
ncbi:MAG: hypothetical protein QE487_05050 [Fluviicola sp.]|nr:hypothetical protein [Fluviicola sp.]